MSHGILFDRMGECCIKAVIQLDHPDDKKGQLICCKCGKILVLDDVWWRVMPEEKEKKQ